MKISFETQKSFDSCRFPSTNKLAKFDFYIKESNILIEYDGIQHFE
jgi:very-short-patch-repair endonuclease